MATSHEHACFFPVGTPEGDDALARNLAAGETAAGLPVDATTEDAAPIPALPIPTDDVAPLVHPREEYLMAGSGTAALRQRDDIVLRWRTWWSSSADAGRPRSRPSRT